MADDHQSTAADGHVHRSIGAAQESHDGKICARERCECGATRLVIPQAQTSVKVMTPWERSQG